MPLEFNLCPANMVQKNPIMEAQTPTIAPALLTNTSTATPTPAVGIAHAVAVANADAAGAEISMTSEVQTMLTRTEDVPAPLPLPNQAITINPTANGDGNGNIDSNANIDLNQGGSNANENDTSVAVAMTNNNMQSSNNANQKVIKARKSFSLKEKVGYVMAFQEDCHSGKPEEKVEEEMKVAPPSENAGAGAVAVDGTKESTTASAKKSKTKKKKTKAKVKPQPTASMHGFKTKKLKAWLKAKNEKDGTNIAYPTMYKWVQKYAQESDISGGGGMENSSSSHSNSKKRNSSALQEEWQSSIGHLKKIRSRPFQELESVLVEFLRVRNDSLRKKGMPVSNVAFIKDRANMFYKDMYNVEVEIFDIATKGTFKCSTGEYTCRVLECVYL